MKKYLQTTFLLVLIGLSLFGCNSSQSPQANAQLTKDFKGGPMPPDAMKKFEESRKKSADALQQKTQSGSQH